MTHPREAFQSGWTQVFGWAAAFAGLNWMQVTEAVKSGLGAATFAVGSLLAIASMIDRWWLDRRRNWDIANKESLSAQIEAMGARHSAEIAAAADARKREAAELLAGQEHARKRMHDALNSLAASEIKSKLLLDQVDELTERVVELAKLNSALAAESRGVRRELAGQPGKVAEAVKAAVDESMGGSASQIQASPLPSES
jgi:hypothetical protein